MTKYPSKADATKQILDIGQRMYKQGFVAANDGNISCRISENTLLTTPTGVSKGFMTPEMILEVDMNGKLVRPNTYKPSSEVLMHIGAYEENKDLMAVTHAHPPISTAFAVAGLPLDLPLLTEAIGALGNVPVAKYGTPGTSEVPDSIRPFCNKYNAVMLANHGVITWGSNLLESFYRMETTEYYAKVTMYVRDVMGKYNMLSCQQVEPLVEAREARGMYTGGAPLCTLESTNHLDALPGSVQDVGQISLSEYGKQMEDLDKVLDDAVQRVLHSNK